MYVITQDFSEFGNELAGVYTKMLQRHLLRSVQSIQLVAIPLRQQMAASG